uniref:HMG box domain-containing protein n=1 Tax=Strigamia maritima TaxID=126957 RepID=T1J7G7_STRMM
MSKKRKSTDEMQRDFSFDSPSSKKQRKPEDMALLSESVSGISRSGRVRKKSAKLMEMEDFETPEIDATDTDGKNQKQQKKGKYSVVASGTAPLDDEELIEEGEGNKKVAPIKICSRPTGSSSSSTKPSVLAGLPASGYISDHPLLSVTINKSLSEGKSKKKSGLKSPIKMEKFSYLIEDDHSPPEISSPKHSTKKKKKKSKSNDQESGLSALDLLAAGGLTDSPPEVRVKSKSRSRKKSSKHGSDQPSFILPHLMDAESPDVDVGDDDLADSSELVIAEPLPKVSSSKKKKKRSHDTGKIKIKIEPNDEFDDIDSSNIMATSTPHSHPHSVYLAEKKKVKKQKVPNSGGKIVGRKGRPMTAYTLWCRDHRPWIVAENPDMDFAGISRRLGEVWQALPDKEKLFWRRQAKRLSAKTLVNSGTSGENQPKSKLLNKQPRPVYYSETELSPQVRDLYKVVGIAPIDVAAHLKLLGESLSIIGQRLTEREVKIWRQIESNFGQIAVSGSLSVLLDSTLCALGPLFCLSAELPEFEDCSHETLGSILDNIAYIMPGL